MADTKQLEFEVIKPFIAPGLRPYKVGERGIYEQPGFLDWTKNTLIPYQNPAIRYIKAPEPLKASDYLKLVAPATDNAVQQSSSAATAQVTAWQYGVYGVSWAGLLYFGHKLWIDYKLGKYTGLYVVGAALLLGYNTFKTFKPLIMPKPADK